MIQISVISTRKGYRVSVNGETVATFARKADAIIEAQRRGLGLRVA
jgi:hypothetical protein